MHRVAASIVTVLLSAFMISNCYAQDDAPPREMMTVDGKVASVDVADSTITIKAGNELTFSISPDASLVSGIYDIKLSDIEPGNDVSVEHYQDPSGNLIATKITVKNRDL